MVENSFYHIERATLTADEAQRIIMASESSRNRCLLRVLVETGMRRAEVASIGTIDIDLEGRRIAVRSTTGSGRREVPITQELAHELRSLVGLRTVGPVFLSNRKAALTPRQINRIVERAGQLAGVRN